MIKNGRLVAINRRDWRLSLERWSREICDKARKIDGLLRKMGTLVNMEENSIELYFHVHSWLTIDGLVFLCSWCASLSFVPSFSLHEFSLVNFHVMSSHWLSSLVPCSYLLLLPGLFPAFSLQIESFVFISILRTSAENISQNHFSVEELSYKTT